MPLPSTPHPVTAATPANWAVLAPHDVAGAQWHFVSITAGSDTHANIQTPLNTAASRLPRDATIAVIAPLTRCVIMAIDLPPLHGVKLQQALASVLGDKLTGAGGTQHYAAAAIENGRIREAAACDAAWLKQCLDALAAAGLRVTQVVPEAGIPAKASAWWGQWPAQPAPAWLVRAANGEAVRVAPPLLSAVLPSADDASLKQWQWFSDPACSEPPVGAPVPCTALSAVALLLRTRDAAWDLRQFSFSPPDAATRFLAWCANSLQQRSGRFAFVALVALIVVNIIGLNFYAMKQQREISARHAEMERIVAQALPGAPRLLEPALQLEAAWQRTRTGTEQSEASTLLGLFALFTHADSASALTALDISMRSLQATFTDNAALERSAAACQSAALRDALQRAVARCTRDAYDKNKRLLLDFERERDAAPAKG